ncbi:uncharacterized protein LOC121611921 isoform X2 [Chelmon rostratus]|uniref:uncharacterized protein LOC121611921 isoform X2 n=1 Tax=Chelmon rostratus TaxID=109905 RepID=UPI001BEA4A29|nr:uncharacterized protein LOC121611921 isoform X2 [Chelmon rostratus]
MTPAQRIVMREISRYVLLGHFLIAVSSVCVPTVCLRCNVTGQTPADSCPLCPNSTAQCISVPPDIPSNCYKDFQVSINTTGSNVKEGDDIILTCVHNLPNLTFLTFWWMKGQETLQGQNESELVLNKVLSHKAGPYTCSVNCSCGIYKSLPHDVSVSNQSMVLLVICGVSALVLVVIMGLAMKFKLKRDNAKHRERMKQREQAEQRGGPAPFTPRES